MSGLKDIEIQVATATDQGTVEPVLHEIRHALSRLARSGEATVIDLQAMPFGPGDEERLLQFLGEGEVRADVRALGLTRVWETAYAGVWLLDYRNEADERIGFQIEITPVPSIVRSQPGDVADASHRLDERLIHPAGEDT